jgi:8-oxo-dGTP pyrophosphatase MutT (NUDIX family)
VYRKLKNSYENTENKKIDYQTANNSHFPNYIKKLKQQLKNTLPGKRAQFKMAPSKRSEEMANNSSQNAGVLILLFPVESEIYTVLIRRPVYKGVHSGQISLPGGKSEPDKDINIVDTAFREAHEEIGIPKEAISFVGKLTPLYIPVSDIYVQPIIGCINKEPHFIPDEREVDSIHKIQLKELLIPECIFEDEIILDDNRKVIAPYYKFNELQIWGATAMILSEFFEIHQKINSLPCQ